MTEEYNPNAILAARIAAALHKRGLMDEPETAAAFVQKIATGKAKVEDWKTVLQASLSSTQPTNTDEAAAVTN